ncbi:MAG: hypothetical protein K9N47_08000 [Prosthecobacter sp.]|uniref:hypothetical protein n=1 Tax=Prosthecobacter sp. TaxID=1965333 RepID=UPI0025E26C87|nr:hypothetical protein [Prosthecobacter sp.]MCF7786049.1 hypothetical protein [Prosthecobacter sp.]
MNPTLRLLICLSAGVVLCQCSSTKKKKKEDPSEQSLVKRTTSGVDTNKRSQYEKYMNDPKLSKGSAGSYFQKQTHHSKNFNGGNSYSGQKEFKTSESLYGRSRTKLDMTYVLGDKQALSKNNSFKADESRFGSQKAREGESLFSGADNQFNTGSALTRSKSIGKAPKIIENYNDKGGGKKSAYSEEEVRKLLNRN